MSAAAAFQAGVKSTATAEWHVTGDLYLGDPRFVLAVPLVLLLLAFGRARRARLAGRMPLFAASLPRTWRQRLGWLPTACTALALVLTSLALARPLRANTLETTISEGVDIALAVDRSGSMRFPDMEEGSTRLDVVKQVVGEFARRRTGGLDSAADSVALVTFALYPELLCPFTLDGEAIVGFLDSVTWAETREEDGTAIGRGLAKAVALLEQTDAKSKVCVLLTDGLNNVDDIAPERAAELAAELGIRVYTILVGRYQYQFDPWRQAFVPTDEELQTPELEAIAELTGGRFYRARDRETLAGVYAEIEALEKTERIEERQVETFDLYPRALWPAFSLYALAWLWRATFGRRLVG